jgi:biotin operon repressor
MVVLFVSFMWLLLAEFPVPQSDLAEALGITTVHVNRVIQSFRAQGVLELKRNMIKLKDLERLSLSGGFNDHYLHQK